MDAKVLVTSPYREFSELVRSVGASMGLNVIIVEGVLEEAVTQVKEVLAYEDIHVVVSRGATAHMLKKEVSEPVISAEFTDFDLLRALWKARKLGSKLAYVCFAYREGYDVAELEEILNRKVLQYYYTCTRELQEAVVAAYRDGSEVIVGGGELGRRFAFEVGLPAVLVHSSQRSVTQALQRAQEVIHALERERLHVSQLRTLTDAITEGAILVDDALQVLVLNDKACAMLGVNRSTAVGKKLDELLPSEVRGKVFGGSGECCIRLGHRELVVNRHPVHSAQGVTGWILTLNEMARIRQLEQKVRQEIYGKGLVAKASFPDLIAVSKVMRTTVEKAREFAATDSTILITGESGTGKELFAQSIHRASFRSDGPFIAINCAALPESLLESELFGYEEGAFTGARKGGKPGLFELAHGGTIFLDEIGAVSANLQGRLLRVLQEKEVMRLGGDSIVPIDVRVVAATNDDLPRAVREGRFRQDLYFRLNVLNLVLPPLRQRREDIIPLLKHFLWLSAERLGKKAINLPSKLVAWVLQYSWPGNIRELQNFAERVIIMANMPGQGDDWGELLIREMEQQLPATSGEDVVLVKLDSLENMEEQLIMAVNERFSGRQSEVAEFLGISRTTLWKKIKQRQNAR